MARVASFNAQFLLLLQLATIESETRLYEPSEAAAAAAAAAATTTCTFDN